MGVARYLKQACIFLSNLFSYLWFNIAYFWALFKIELFMLCTEYLTFAYLIINKCISLNILLFYKYLAL